MNAEFLLRIAKTSLSTSLLIGLLLLLVPLLQKRYRAKWRYFAWLVIAVRLLIPINLSLPQTPINIELPEQKTLATVTTPTNERPYLQMDIPGNADNAATWNFEEASGMPDEPVNPSIAVTPIVLACVAWLFGVLVFLLFQICSYHIFLRKLKASRKEDAPPSIKETVWSIGVDMGICKLPEPLVTDAVDAPVLIGMFHPCILLPHTRYSDEKISFILRHELVHYRRRDMWYKLVLLLANALHWFNPLVYLMTVQAAKDIELTCDDDITKELDRDARARYGDTILSALPLKRRLEPMFSTHFGSTKQNMKDRLRNLFDMTAKRRGIAALCAVIACALTLTSFVTLGYAAAKPDSVPTANEKSSQVNLSVQRLGKHSFKSGDKLKTNIRWNGKSTVMILCTEQDYNNDELLAPLQGIPGLPKPNYNNVDKTKNMGVFNFNQAQSSPLTQEQKITKSGSYYIYIVQFGFDKLIPLTGEVNRVDAGGDIYGIWGAQSDAVTKNAAGEVPTLTGSNNITVKSIKAGEVSCIGKIELGPDSAYTATLSVESGSGAMIALNSSPNITTHMGTSMWNQLFSGTNNIYFSSEQPKTAYVYVGSQTGIGTKLTNVKVHLVQTKSPVSPEGNPYFQIKSNGKSVLHSGSFEAKAGQTLTITTASDIKGGTVDFFLFSPMGKEQRFTFDRTNSSTGSNSGEITVPLSAGKWAYNCTGFFDSGDIVITGTVTSGVKTKSTAADKAAYEVMKYSRSWTMAEYMLPYMTKDGIDAVVKLNNELNPSSRKTASDYYGLTTPSKTESGQRSYSLMEKSGNWTYSSPLFPYMTNGGIDRVVALYNQKTGKNMKASDYYIN